MSAAADPTSTGRRSSKEREVDAVPSSQVALAAFRYLADVCGVVFSLLKAPLAFSIAMLVGSTIMAKVIRSTVNDRISFVVGQALNTVLHPLLHEGQSMLCTLPLLSTVLVLCNKRIQDTTDFVSYPDFPGFMDIQTRAFDQLVGQSEAGLIIALDIRQAELSIRDLVVVVKASGLHDKALIASALETFVWNSRDAARALEKLSTRIYGIVDEWVEYIPWSITSQTDQHPPALPRRMIMQCIFYRLQASQARTSSQRS